MRIDSRKISVCIATYNMGHLIHDTLNSIINQSCQDIEICIYDDCSSDNTRAAINKFRNDHFAPIEIKYKKGRKNIGVGSAFNEAIKMARGEFVVLMCADDLICEKHYLEDVRMEFSSNEGVGYITRFYYQFTECSCVPVRAWRSKDHIVLANNPSGLAFRRRALYGKKCSNKMFIETSQLAKDVIEKWDSSTITYDAIAVRVHDSTSCDKNYWLKRRQSSPVLDWSSLGCKEIAKDYVSLIQIKNGFTVKAVIEEIFNFVKIRPLNIISPLFIFFSIVSIVTPRSILRHLPKIYRKYVGWRITKRIMRNGGKV